MSRETILVIGDNPEKILEEYYGQCGDHIHTFYFDYYDLMESNTGMYNKEGKEVGRCEYKNIDLIKSNLLAQALITENSYIYRDDYKNNHEYEDRFFNLLKKIGNNEILNFARIHC